MFSLTAAIHYQWGTENTRFFGNIGYIHEIYSDVKFTGSASILYLLLFYTALLNFHSRKLSITHRVLLNLNTQVVIKFNSTRRIRN